MCFGELIGGDGRRWEPAGNLGLFAPGGSFTTLTGGSLGGRGPQHTSPLWPGDLLPVVPGDPVAPCHGARQFAALRHCPGQHLAGVSKLVMNPSEALGPCSLLMPRENKLSVQAGGGALSA